MQERGIELARGLKESRSQSVMEAADIIAERFMEPGSAGGLELDSLMQAVIKAPENRSDDEIQALSDHIDLVHIFMKIGLITVVSWMTQQASEEYTGDLV